MIEYTYVGTGSELTRETKSGWARGTLAADTHFIHGTGLEPSRVRKTGISPEFAREFLVDPQGRAIGGGKMVFAFQVVAGGDAPANAGFRISPAVKRMFEAGHSYVFKAPAGTVIYCQGGTPGTAKETAFPYVIESTDIEFYIPPGSKENISWRSSKAIAAMLG